MKKGGLAYRRMLTPFTYQQTISTRGKYETSTSTTMEPAGSTTISHDHARARPVCHTGHRPRARPRTLLCGDRLLREWPLPTVLGGQWRPTGVGVPDHRGAAADNRREVAPGAMVRAPAPRASPGEWLPL